MRGNRKGLIVVACCVCQWVLAQDIECNLENNSVAKFLEEVSYTRDSESEVNNYKWIDYPQRADIPRPVTIAVPPVSSDSVTISYWLLNNRDKMLSTDIQRVRVPSDSVAVEIYNLVPQQYYCYQVTADDSIVASGEIHTTGHLRMIYAGKAFNVRDIGGWETISGKRIMYGRLFRGSELNGNNVVDSCDLETLRSLGIGAELDFRYKKEDDGAGISAFGFLDSTIKGEGEPTYLFTNNLGVARYTFTSSYYLSKLKSAYSFLIKQLQNGKAVYCHCMWGADRTGLFCMFLEGLLGVDYDGLMKEYELTTFYVGSQKTKDERDDLIDFIMDKEGDTLQEKFESFFLNNIKMSATEISYLKTKMLEQKSSVTTGVEIYGNTVQESRNPTVWTDLQGRRVSGLGHGLMIGVGADGSVRKQFVK